MYPTAIPHPLKIQNILIKMPVLKKSQQAAITREVTHTSPQCNIGWLAPGRDGWERSDRVSRARIRAESEGLLGI
jgi:hypothetical protein